VVTPQADLLYIAGWNSFEYVTRSSDRAQLHIFFVVSKQNDKAIIDSQI
jgi:hypothetical protein